MDVFWGNVANFLGMIGRRQWADFLEPDVFTGLCQDESVWCQEDQFVDGLHKGFAVYEAIAIVVSFHQVHNGRSTFWLKMMFTDLINRSTCCLLTNDYTN